MKTFVSLVKLTKAGKAEITKTFERRDVLTPAMERLSVKMEQYFMTLGAFDYVIVFRAPSDEAMAEFLLILGRLGAVETTTMTALDADAYGGLIERLSNAE